MMEWTDTGVVVAVRPFGETGAVVELMTETQGRHAGLVHGGASRRMRPLLQPGNRLRARWKARIADQLGSLSVEADELRAGRLMDDAAALDGVRAACALASIALPEREPHAAVYYGLEALLAGMESTDLWPALLVRWEAGLLADLGYGLDLTRCAVTGEPDDLTHVSPKSGRSVSREAAAPYLDKVLKLPPFLLGTQTGVAAGDVRDGFTLTGWFIERRILWPADRKLPEARTRLIERLETQGRL